MALDSDIRNQAYQFFIQEAPELLQVIEAELLTLKKERSTAKVHNLMRAAHSIKGGAASVGLETIKTLAHSVEDIFNSLHSEELEIDAEVESLLLSAYDCLRLPLMEQITTGKFDSEQAMLMAEPVFAQIEARLGDFLRRASDLPSSLELGVDIALSIFEVDIAQGLERLTTVLAHPQDQEVAGELRAQAEVFAGIAELLNLPGFGAIAQTALMALDAHPNQALQIAQLALADFQVAQQAVIAGDRTSGGAPSTALVELATLSYADALDSTAEAVVEQANAFFSVAEVEIPTISSLDELFGDFLLPQTTASNEILSIPVIASEPALEELHLDIDIDPVEQQDYSSELFQAFLDTELVELMPQSSDDFVFASASAAQEFSATPSLEEIFGGFAQSVPAAPEPVTPTTAPSQELFERVTQVNTHESIEELVQSIEQTFDSLLPIDTVFTAENEPDKTEKLSPLVVYTKETNLPTNVEQQPPAAQMSVRVGLDRLERINNLVGELSINRNSLALQNEQLQEIVQELLRRFAKFQGMGRHLRTLSDQMLVAKEGHSPLVIDSVPERAPLFDSLEMDSYGELNSLLQATFEEIVQLEETAGDVVLLAGQSSQTIEQQRQMLGHLRDDVMWARMLPLAEVLNRFPRTLRDLSTSYEKPVDLKLSGTGVLVDKAALEKLYDPLLHLLRNAFDHGIEPPEERNRLGKRSPGQIEIRAYHQGSQTIIEVRDDGQGINLERIRSKALTLGIFSPEQVAAASPSRLLELLFEPGFSTAAQVSQLSGRGVGLDVVRAQVRSLKGSVSVTTEPGRGTTFALRIPLTLTIAKLLICVVGSTAFAFPCDSIAEILIPQPNEVKQFGGQRFLQWREQLVTVHHLGELLNYACPTPASASNRALAAIPAPEDWALPMLLIEREQQVLALEIDRLVTEQELVIKPLGGAIAPPKGLIYGCSILGDGSLIPVIDGTALLESFMSQSPKAITVITDADLSPSMTADIASRLSGEPGGESSVQRDIAPTLLVVDDSMTVRQTLTFTLQKAGYRVLQARDGREAIDQLQQSTIQLVICDIEMPNMNGFEFLSYRRTDPLLSKIPVVMLTSRSSNKHRQLAMHSGANAYFTKPYIEQEFLAGIKDLIKGLVPTLSKS